MRNLFTQIKQSIIFFFLMILITFTGSANAVALPPVNVNVTVPPITVNADRAPFYLTGATTDINTVTASDKNKVSHTTQYNQPKASSAVCEVDKAAIENAKPVVVPGDKLGNVFGDNAYTNWVRISTLDCTPTGYPVATPPAP